MVKMSTISQGLSKGRRIEQVPRYLFDLQPLKIPEIAGRPNQNPDSDPSSKQGSYHGRPDEPC